MILVVGGSLLTLDLLDSPVGWEPDDLMEGRGDCPNIVDPRSSKDKIVGRWTNQHNKGHMEVYPTGVD